MFSKATEYALRAAIYVAQKSSAEKKIGIAEIARAIDSPESFTAKIMQALTRDDKIISSARGPKGGFFITEKAKKLPARRILQAMGEDELLESCVLGLKKCSEVLPCPMHAQYKSIKIQLIKLFEFTTIAALARDMQKGEAFIKNKK